MHLINQKLNTEQKSSKPIPTNHNIVIDCSGSMYGEIEKIKTHLKNKIPTMVQDGDSLTVVWFSGRDQYGVLFENLEINSLVDLAKINQTLDRYLKTVGLTGFKQPLEEVLAICMRNQSKQQTLSLMSDGYDNCWSKADIVRACNSLSSKLVSVCFVEYGYYADHDMLMLMAEETGGSVVQATDFNKYAFQLEGIRNKNFGKRIQLDVSDVLPSDYNFYIGHTSDGFVISKANNGVVSFPSNTKSYSFFEGDSEEIESIDDVVSACDVVAALIQRGQADVAILLAGKIGDVDLYKQVENAFSKQDLVKVVETAQEYSAQKKKLFATAERNKNLVPDPFAYNILTLLMDLSEGEGNSLVISDPSFDYTAIGAKREAVVADDGFQPVFKDKNKKAVVADIQNLVFHNERPNISLLVKREGSVNLPENSYGFGDSFDTFIWRNYTIVRDGIVNVSKLPVKLSRATYDLLCMNGMKLDEYKVNKTYVLDLSELPAINRSMVEKRKSTDFFAMCFEEYLLECEQKYINSLIEKPEVGQKFEAMYGEEAAKFLKSIGVTEGGFSPKTIKTEEVDSYIAKTLTVKMAGMSSVPKISDVEAAMQKGKKLTVSQECVLKAMNKHAKTKDFEAAKTKIKNDLKSLRRTIVETKFGVILGRKWFVDMNGYDDNVREVDFGLSKKISCEVLLKDKEI